MTDYLGDKSFEELGIVMLQSYQHPVPSTRDMTLAIPGRHGTYDFGATLDSRYFDLSVALIANDRVSMQSAIRTLSAHLFDAYGKPKTQKLVFDEEPDKFYWVRYSGSMPIQRIVGVGIFNLPLVAHDPFANFIVPSDEISWDSDIPIDADVLWNTGLGPYQITQPETLVISNSGSQTLRLSYTLEGSGNDVTISANGKSFSLGSFTDTTWEINGDKFTIKENGVNNLTSMTGDFIELFPGENNVTFSGSSLNLTFSESLTFKYI